MSSSCFVIAEAGVNHNGSEDLALRLVEAAAASGADAVKFQTYRAENIALPGTETAAYQRAATGEHDQFAMLKSLELPLAALHRLKARADEVGIEWMSTPADAESANALVALGVRRIKVGSAEITNLPFLELLASFDIPLIVSTGMSDLDEVAVAIEAIAAVRSRKAFDAPLAERLTLLHCTSNYPAKPEDLNLRAMAALDRRFGLPVGYSDHSEGTVVAAAAVALGARVLEKHFTLDRSLPGPDHAASLEPGELRRMVGEIRAVEAALGDGVKAPRPAELAVRDLVRRSIVLSHARRAGERISLEDLAFLRPGRGISPAQCSRVAGKRAARDLPAGTVLAWKDLLD